MGNFMTASVSSSASLHPKTLISAAAGILVKGHEVLIAKRPLHKPQGGWWEFPGGKKEEGESSFETLARELKEEIGVRIHPEHTHFLLNLHNHYNDKEASIDVFLVKGWEGEPEALEGQTLRFVTMQTLQEGQLKFLPGLDKVLPYLAFLK